MVENKAKKKLRVRDVRIKKNENIIYFNEQKIIFENFFNLDKKKKGKIV